jgi:predicted SAM-dependent methyltransferase
MRLNLGCGKMVLDGFVNIDIQQNPKAKRPLDILADVRSVPLHDECADEVHAYHVIEHFYRWQTPEVLGEWKRLLKAGGLLVLELPNIEAAARNLLAGMDDQMCMWAFYGDPSHRDPYMCHPWGFTPKSIKSLLSECGFSHIELKPPQTHGRRVNRDMRVEARKP